MEEIIPTNQEKGLEEPQFQTKQVRKFACEQMYVDLELSVEDCAVAIHASPKTIYRWIKEGNWNEKRTEALTIEKQITVNLKKAINQGLKCFANDPTNKDLQSLVSLLKQFKEQNKPSVAYKDNIIKFLDQSVDYFLSKGFEEFTRYFQANLHELAEYLLNR